MTDFAIFRLIRLEEGPGEKGWASEALPSHLEDGGQVPTRWSGAMGRLSIQVSPSPLDSPQ